MVAAPQAGTQAAGQMVNFDGSGQILLPNETRRQCKKMRRRRAYRYD